jgi:hypothetical protein
VRVLVADANRLVADRRSNPRDRGGSQTFHSFPYLCLAGAPVYGRQVPHEKNRLHEDVGSAGLDVT